MARGHVERLDSVANFRIYSIWCLDASLPTLKERTVFALPSCRSILLLSHTKSPLHFCPPHSCQSLLSPPLHQAPVPTLQSNHSAVQPILLHDPSPYCWRLQQASSGSNSKLSLHSNSALKPLLVAKPTCSVPVRAVDS